MTDGALFVLTHAKPVTTLKEEGTQFSKRGRKLWFIFSHASGGKFTLLEDNTDETFPNRAIPAALCV